MRKVTYMFIAAVLLALSLEQAYVRRYPQGIKGIELRSSFVNESKEPLNYYIGVTNSGYSKRAYLWAVGAVYLVKKYDYQNITVFRAQFIAE